MKFMKWKILLVTCLVCLLPILLGLALWNRLPESIAIHFDMHNTPDNFASKGFAVFGLPLLMVLMQTFGCFVNDINAAKHGECKKFERAAKWIIPVLCVTVQMAIFGYALGWDVDVRKVAAILVGLIFLVIGNYLPKVDYIKNYDIAAEKARKINRFIGFEMVVMGILFLVSIFLPPTFTVACVFLLIPYTGIGVIYGIKVAKK